MGGPVGRHAVTGTGWWSPARVALLVGTLVYLAGVVFRLPCRWGADHFKFLCYSDIGLLYPDRGLLQGNTPYLDSGDYPVLEYPVLTGWFLELERRITALLGGQQGTDLTEAQIRASTLIFVDVNTVLLGALLLIAIWAQVRIDDHRPWDAMMLAASPCVAAAALINWDLLPVALTALAMLSWSRRRPGLTGVLLGLGMAAKLYPGLLIGPLFLLCLRGRRMRDFVTTLCAAILSWGAVNLPVLLLAPDAWRSFWAFNSDRGGDLGSIWYVLSLAGHEVQDLNVISAGLFALCCLAIGVLIMMAPRRPRFGAMAFLVVVAFLLTNKVYSPQYVLWLLPLLILARPQWRDWLIFTAGELLLLRRHLVASGRPADPRRQLGRPDLLAGRGDPAEHPELGGDHGRPRRPASRVRPGTRRWPGRPDRRRPRRGARCRLVARPARTAATGGQEGPCWFGRLRSDRRPASTRRRHTAAAWSSRRGSPAAG